MQNVPRVTVCSKKFPTYLLIFMMEIKINIRIKNNKSEEERSRITGMSDGTVSFLHKKWWKLGGQFFVIADGVG